MKKIFLLLLSLFLLVGTLSITSCSKNDDTPANTPSDTDPLPTPVPQRIQSDTFTVNGVTFVMMLVKAGTFTMGATPEQENPNDDESPAHQVTLTNDYYLGQTEVTQQLWQAVLGPIPPFFEGDNLQGDSLPMIQVSWDECQNFISRLNDLTGRQFRLPTEAEWEFAARGGNNNRGYQYAGSNNPNDVAWYYNNSYNNSDIRPHPVMTKSPNELGFYDMSGNVDEWCQDGYGPYRNVSQTNPTGAMQFSERVMRGGNWYSNANKCRVACRNSHPPYASNFYIGFRLALSD